MKPPLATVARRWIWSPPPKLWKLFALLRNVPSQLCRPRFPAEAKYVTPAALTPSTASATAPSWKKGSWREKMSSATIWAPAFFSTVLLVALPAGPGPPPREDHVRYPGRGVVDDLRLIESDMTPTFTPAPLTPSARAAGPLCAASPAEVTAPTSVPSAASVPVAVMAETAWVTSRAAMSSARETGT